MIFLLVFSSRVHGWCFRSTSIYTGVLASDFYVNIFGAFTENTTQEISTIAPQRIVERISFKTRSLLEIMAPGRKRSSVRSDNVQENTATPPPSRQAAPTIGVTRAELDAVVLGLNQ